MILKIEKERKERTIWWEKCRPYIVLLGRDVMAREWEGQSRTWAIARLSIIDIKDRKGKERENYLVGEMQALYSSSRREDGLHLTNLE